MSRYIDADETLRMMRNSKQDCPLTDDKKGKNDTVKNQEFEITIAEIITGLEHCVNPVRDANCSLSCPWGGLAACKQNLMYHALSAIQKLFTIELEIVDTFTKKLKEHFEDKFGYRSDSIHEIIDLCSEQLKEQFLNL